MKLSVTADEHAKLEEARRILGEINTSLRHRGIDVYFTVTTARDGVLAEPDGMTLVLGEVPGVPPCR